MAYEKTWAICSGGGAITGRPSQSNVGLHDHALVRHQFIKISAVEQTGVRTPSPKPIIKMVTVDAKWRSGNGSPMRLAVSATKTFAGVFTRGIRDGMIAQGCSSIPRLRRMSMRKTRVLPSSVGASGSVAGERKKSRILKELEPLNYKRSKTCESTKMWTKPNAGSDSYRRI